MWSAIKKAINSNINVPLNEGGVRIVKSVQRGTASGNKTITISAVNVNKSIIILNGSMAVGVPSMDHITHVGSGGSGYISAFNSTSFTIAGASASTSYVSLTCTNSWQVIEFY